MLQSNSSLLQTNSFAGTLFLFAFWPSFNGVLAASAGNSQYRMVVNTVLSLTSSALATLAFSRILRGGKFGMIDLQRATLAGGVAIGVAGLTVEPYAAMLIGLVSGAVATFGYRFGTDSLARVGLHDSCGVNNLHGLPGLIGAVAGSIAAGVVDDTVYGEAAGDIFSARAGDARVAAGQAGAQLYALLVTLGIAVAGGLFTGFIVANPMIAPAPRYFDDEENFEGVDPYASTSGGRSKRDIEMRA